MKSIKGVLSAFFLSSENPSFRERLSGFEQQLFDKHAEFQDNYPDHKVLLVTGPSVGPDTFESFPDAKTAYNFVRSDKDFGVRTFVALDLTRSFKAQWTHEPGKLDRTHYFRDSISRAPGCPVAALNPPQAFRSKIAVNSR